MATMAQMPVALQLYTVRQQLAEDYEGTLRAVKEIGYDFIQITGAIPYEAAEMKALLDDIGLQASSIDVMPEELSANLDHWIAYAKALGTRDLVYPWTHPDQRKTHDDWTAIFSFVEETGAKCAEQGMRLSYHHHAFEFEPYGDSCILDALLDRTSPQHVYAELDTYWIKRGGADPATYIRKYAGRLPMLHLKDMADDEKKSFAEVGTGVLDWQGIHAAAIDAGVEVYAVEQDVCPGDPLDSARGSLEFVRKLLRG